MRPNQRQQTIIRLAKIEEAQLLSELSMRSKAHWGYDAQFLEACREDLTITSENIATRPFYVIEEHNHIAGFYGLQPVDDDTVVLSDLFVEPEAIGQGCGKQLWQHAIKTARQLGFRTMELDSDPYAEPFYKAMGAQRIGEVPSTVLEGRVLPLMRYDLR